MKEEQDNWMPLESNPEVINAFISKMGLKVQQFNFQEMLSIEEWAQEMIPQPVLGIMLLYEQSPAQLNFKKQQQESLKPEEVPKDVFYMKQFAHNACGTIALFHIIVNALSSYPDIVEANSYLSKFRQEAANKEAKERGQIFKKSKQIKTEHKGASQQGQSAVQSSVDSHFIAFVEKEGSLWELDGNKKCAVNHGPCLPPELVSKGCSAIQQFINRDPDNLNFAMIVLAKKQE